LVLIQAKAFIDDVGGDGGGALWVSFFLAGALGSCRVVAPRVRGENPLRHWTCDDDAFGVVFSLEASHLELVSACGSGTVGSSVELLVRNDRRGVQGPCWWGGVEGPWQSGVLGWCACCSGDRGIS
jgi:hypothetical protein